jgi:hypothetical protein
MFPWIGEKAKTAGAGPPPGRDRVHSSFFLFSSFVVEKVLDHERRNEETNKIRTDSQEGRLAPALCK